MKIAKIEAIPVSYPEPNDFNALRHLCLAKITADDGQVGWGESITQFPEANFAVKAIIDGMAPNLIGKDPVHTEVLWRQNKHQAWWYGYGGGIASYAVAALDIALWDLKGKALGRSVLDLLGGPVHERLPGIASCHAHYESIPDMAAETVEWLSTGLQGLKTGFGKRGNARLGYDHDRDVAYVKAIIDGMAPNLIGKDPVHTEALWRQNKHQAWWYGYGGGIASYAVAALDIALWDLKGKALGRSVLDLLGGPVHERLPGIASCHAHYESIEEMAEETVEWLSTGLQGLKTGFGKRGNARLGYEHDRYLAYVKAMRAVMGDKQLMIDCGINVKWDVTQAVRRVQAMEEYGLAWIEEPLGAWDPEGYANLRAKTTTLIAYGEKEWTLEGFERVLATGTVDVIGVDPGRGEGITGFKKVCDRVEAYRRQANAHAWSSAIVTAASLAISFSSPACKLFEFKPLRNPMQHDLVTKPFDHV
ncbi:MAG TPA: enolase C-terminal domain-like protein, partial [Dongiaceae bacterium]